jgi:hypothetical protein
MQAAAALRLPTRSKGSEFISSENWMTLQDGPHVVSLNRHSGSLIYQDRRSWNVTQNTKFELTDAEAVNTARSFVSRARLVPEWRTQLAVAAVTHLRMQGAPAGGEAEPETLLDAAVVFRREVDGVPVTGPGGILVLTISPAGAVVGVNRVWRARGARAGRVAVIAPDQAMARVRTAYARKDLIGTVRVTRAEFGYFEAGPYQTQRYIEPSYAFIIESVLRAEPNAPVLRYKTGRGRIGS